MKNKLLTFLLVCALAAVLLGPIFARPRNVQVGGGRALIIITPNNEAVRFELARAFTAAHKAKTGEQIYVDWRTPGGGSEIARYLESEFVSAFESYWTKTLGNRWSAQVEASFMNSKVEPKGDDWPQRARRAYLESNVSSGIDLLFGGGTFDHKKQAAAGNTVDSGILQTETFRAAQIPATMGGETYWDAKGRWVGTCLSAFGISSNLDALQRLGVEQTPRQWSDLANPKLVGQVALANPTQSSSLNAAFEMMVQQQMLAKLKAGAPEKEAIDQGWGEAMRMIKRIGGNARYFTDAAGKVTIDIAAGEAASGLTIDFYGRFQSGAVARPDGSSRMQYYDAAGGTSFSADAVSMLRGAPHPDLAREFIAWLLTPEAQRLWNSRPGTPGGPSRFALRRLPIMPAMYAPELRQFRSDPDVLPYEMGSQFQYHGAWTGPLFGPIAFIVRVMCIDAHDELKDAWRALIEANFPPAATALFADVSAVDYATTSGRIRETLAGEKIAQVQLAKELAGHFRAQYREVARLARVGQ